MLLQNTVFKNLKFINDIVFPDKNIPLLNDSAFNIAPTLEEINEYANKLFSGADELKQLTEYQEPLLIDKPDSGLYGYRAAKDMFIIDCGDIGPSYQPGHTHCDFLSYELMLNDKRLIVDTGVCEYEPGEMRHYLRSTSAHNTLRVGQQEQSEVWGEFRVARRAKKIQASITKSNNRVMFSGEYQGFHSLRANIKHKRDVDLTLKDNKIDQICIVDIVTGAGNHLAESFVHFHPDVEVKDRGNGQISLRLNKDCWQLTITEPQHYQLEDSVYCPEFGMKIPGQVLVMSRQTDLPCKLGYKIDRYRADA